MYKWLLTLLLLSICLQSHALEDYIITTDGKLSDIKIQDESIVEIIPLVTIDNKKNTIFVFPKKTGVTSFTIKKDSCENYLFHVKVEDNRTIISDIKGFKVIAMDNPPADFELDLPPEKLGDYLDSPPILKEKEAE